MNDASDYAVVTHRLRWWRRHELCARFVKHWDVELEPGVRKCRLCGCLTFNDVTLEQLERHLLGGVAELEREANK